MSQLARNLYRVAKIAYSLGRETVKVIRGTTPPPITDLPLVPATRMRPGAAPEVNPMTVQIDPEVISVREKQGVKWQFVDVRETNELHEIIQGATLIPYSQFESRLQLLPKEAPLVLYCATGF